MTRPRDRPRRTLEVAEQLSRTLAGRGVATAVIGGVAVAAHKYLRATKDFDLAAHAHPYPSISALERELASEGFEIEFRDPDAEDPLGGVLNVRGDDFDDIQVVNFFNPYTGRNAVAEEAIATSKAGLIDGSELRIIDLPHLIALKLQCGRRTDLHDTRELLERNAPLDLAPVRDVCGRHGLGPALEAILGELGAGRLEGRS